MNLFNSVLGNIGTPEHLKSGYGDLESGGMLTFLSAIVKLVMVVGGIWTFINLILAGFSYVVSGDNPEEIKKANSKITYSLIGLILMVASIAIAAILGWILFGDVNAILNPEIHGPETI